MTHRIHFLSPGLFQEDRFTGEILTALRSRCDIEVKVHEVGGAGPWTFQGRTYHGLREDLFAIESSRGLFKVVDFQDSAAMTGALCQSPNFRGAAVMMYQPATVHAMYGDKSHLISPGWFLDQEPKLARAFRPHAAKVRSNWDALDPRLYFRGTIDGDTLGVSYRKDGRNIREVALVLRDRYPDEVDVSGQKETRSSWFLGAAGHQMVLTLPGHPWCYREFELMSIGVPIITYRWTSYLHHQPLHYFPVEGVEQDAIGFALDPEKGAEAIIAKFRQIRSDRQLLEARARQAQRWYDRYCSPETIAEDMLSWLDLESL